MLFEQSETIHNSEEVLEEKGSFYHKTELDMLPEIVLKPEEYGKGFPKGALGERRGGYSFFELRKEKEGIKVYYLTSRIGGNPLLEAVTKSQFDSWKKKQIIARPVEFAWSEEKGIWIIESRRE